VTLKGASAAATAELDGNGVDLGKPIRVDPGPHRLLARDGGKLAEATTSTRAGDRDKVVEVIFSPGPAQRSALPPPPAPTARSHGSVVPGIALLAVGGAGIAA